MKILSTIVIFLITGAFTLAQKTTTIRIDPDNGLGGTTSQIFDSVKFIPLETKKESLFGKIYQLEITEKYFVIADFDTWSILLFDKQGKFHTRIRQRSENEYFSSFSLDRQAKTIILPVSNSKILVYDFNGKLISEKKRVEESSRLFYFNPRSVAFHINRPLKLDKQNNIGYDLSYSDSFNKLTKQFLPYNSKFQQYEYNIPDIIFSDNNNGTCFFTFPYKYTASLLNGEGIIHQYNFIFPQKNSLPPNFASDSIFAGKRKDFVFSSQENTGKYIGLTPFFKQNNFLLFHIQQVGRVYGENDNILYSLKTGNSYVLNKVTGDARSFYINVLDSHFAEDLLGIDAEHVYTTISAVTLFELKSSTNKATKYSPELDTLFAKGTPRDNPVIIESRLKADL